MPAFDFYNKFLSLKLEQRILEYYVERVLSYGYESWTINEQARKMHLGLGDVVF